MESREVKIVYRVKREHEHGYTTDHLWIAEYTEEDTTARLAGTVENRDGYDTSAADGGKTTAAKLSCVFSAMLNDGHSKFYDWGYGHHSFWIRYQVYQNPDAERPDYCHPRLEMPSELAGVRWALKFVEKFGRKIERDRAKVYEKERGYACDVGDVDDHTIDQLQEVTAALDKLGAIRVEDWVAPGEGWHSPPHYWVAVKK
jgi:hypothetical protein